MKSTYWLTRLFYLRGLGFMYCLIGIILFRQGPALMGPNGLTPIQSAAASLAQQMGSVNTLFWSYPSLLWLSSTDLTLKVMAIIAIAFGILMLSGRCNLPMLLVLGVIQLSLVNAGGTFYGFGWETLLVEMTFLSLIFVHPWRWDLLSFRNLVPQFFHFVPLLWLCFRLLFGAGMIKIRGDACWLDFTCMDYHYQTQPNPNPLSWYYHFLPSWFHKIEVGLTHFYELLVPFLFLLIRPLRIVGGLLIIFFQLTLISTGNLAFLNWQTIILCFVAFDDQFLRYLTTRATQARLIVAERIDASMVNNVASWTFCALIAVLSYQPIKNLISPQQHMNQSYSRWHLVNSYGLFGSITKERYEVIISGTPDPNPQSSNWSEYGFFCKPGDVAKRPCFISPYHLRLDWQMWFSAMRPEIQEMWLAELAKKMLNGDPNLNTLLDHNPFAGEPPQFVKMDLYLYEFNKDGSPLWWKRTFVKPYLNPVSKNSFSAAPNP